MYKTVTIFNKGQQVISITNVKVTYTQDPQGVQAAELFHLEKEGTLRTIAGAAAWLATPPAEQEPGDSAPDTTIPGTTAPETTVPGTTAPETTVPGAATPEATVPGPTAPEATVPGTTAPEGSVPGTTAPEAAKPTTPEASPPRFSDVTADKYYYAAVEWAVKSGITTGKTATTFQPERICTRSQVVAFLFRIAGLTEND